MSPFRAIFLCGLLAPALVAAYRPFRPPVTFISEKFRNTAYSICYRTETSQSQGDSCYGCFMRAVNEAQCNGTEQRLAECSKEHLTGSKYDTCTKFIENADENNIEGEGTPDTYNSTLPACDFQNCLREVGVEVLIEECLAEIPEGVTGSAHFKNMTACVLAKQRCKTTARNIYGSTLQSLLVTENNQIRIVDVPGMIQDYECRAQNDYRPPSMIQPAQWPTAMCNLTCY